MPIKCRKSADKLDEIVLDDAKLVASNGSNAFAVKKLLNHDDLTSNYLVYSPVSYDRPDDNWLLDIELYSEEFRAGLDVQNNAIYQEFVNYGVEDAFSAKVRQGCGFYEEEHDLGRLAIHLLLTASTRTLRPEYLAGLDSFISMPHQAYCYDFVSEWLKRTGCGIWTSLCHYAERH